MLLTKVTVPEGSLALPAASVSVTVTEQIEVSSTTIGVWQMTSVVVARALTAMAEPVLSLDVAWMSSEAVYVALIVWLPPSTVVGV